MLVLIEGLDRTGKSSLAARLWERSGYASVLHWDKPQTGNPYEEYLKPLAYDPKQNRDVICDRHYIGEMVWPVIFGRASILRPGTRAMIDNRLNELGAVLVHAYRDPAEVQEDIDNDPEQPEYSASEADAMFWEAIRRSWLPTIQYRFEHLTRHAEQIIEFARARQELRRQ